MVKICFSLLAGIFFLTGCQKKEEAQVDLGKIVNMEEEEPLEWSLPQKVVLEEEDSLEEVVLFEKDSYGEELR